MTEVELTAWFAAHPFTRTLAVLAYGAISSFAIKDYMNYKVFKAQNPDATYRWLVLTKNGFYGLLTAIGIAIIPELAATVLRILGGGQIN